MNSHARVKLVAALALFAACNLSEPAPKHAAPVPSNTAAPFDLSRVVEQVHFAYRQEGAAWTARHSTYRVRVEGGALDLQPLHFPRGRPEAVERAKGVPIEGASVRFGAAEVRRGGRAVSTASGSVRGGAQGQLLLETGAVVETLQNSEQGVEQSWRFETLPQGTGALEVRVPVVDGRFAGATATGLHFQAGALMVRYGHGTWVDAAGRRSEVPARYESGAVVLRVSNELLAQSAFPAVLDPVIGPEFGMDTPVFGPSTGSPSGSVVAWGGTSYLVVWSDFGAVDLDVYAARVSSAGVVLDSGGIVISTAAGDQSLPAVAWNGTAYFVAWQDLRSGTNLDVYGARVSAAGVVQDAAGIAISTAAGDQAAPALAWGGTQYLVAWEDYRNGAIPDVYGARVSAAGLVQEPTGIAVSTATAAQTAPAVAFDGTNYLVVWEDLRAGGGAEIYGARVNPAGVVQEASGFAIAAGTGTRYSPALAWAGSNYLVAWMELHTTTNYDVYGARVSAGGVVQDVPAIAIATAANEQGSPAVAAVGSNYFVVWQDRRSGADHDIYGARVSAGGVVQDAAGIVVASGASEQMAPTIASDGTSYFAVWGDFGTSGFSTVVGSRVSAAGAVQDVPAITLSKEANPQSMPAVAWDGTNYLVAWSDFRSGATADLYGARVSAAGVVLDPAGIAISTAANDQYPPAIAWNGTYYLVVWMDYRAGATADIYGARVSTAGTVLEPTGLAISTATGNQYYPAVASDGANFLVAWTDARGGTAIDLYGARVSGSGTVLEASGIALSTAANSQANAAVAWDGTNYLVVWQDYRNGTTPDIYGTRVSLAGAVLDSTGIAISTAAGGQSSPAVAWNGTNYLVVWQDLRNGATPDIYGARVTAAGAVLEAAGLSLSTAANAQTNAAVTWDGTNYLVVWQALRSGTNYDLYAARVSSAGAVQDASDLALSTGTTSARNPAIVSRGNRQALLVYETNVPSLGANANRVVGRLVTFDEAPVATPQTVTTAEDTAAAITLAGTDVEGDTLTFAVVTQPAHGALTGSGASLTYTPAANYNGADSFTFKANDGRLDSAPATLSLTVTPVNDAPVATPQSVTTAEDTAAAITLAGTDVDGDSLSFAVVTPPAHGALTGSGASLTYTPAANYNGADSFTFKANDGLLDSAPATVSLTVAPVNDAPVATPQSVTTAEDTAVAITLAGTDVDGDSLSFAVVTQPAHGALTGSGASLTYTPAANYNGADSFTFKANDGALDSAAATVSLTVQAVNDAPVFDAIALQVVPKDSGTHSLPVTGIGPGGGPDEAAQTVTLVATSSAPAVVANPSVTGSGSTRTLSFSPVAGASGTATITVTATDNGGPDTFSREFDIDVTATNHAPVAQAGNASSAGAAIAITLQGSDADGDVLTYTVVTQPSHGALEGAAPSLVYTPEAGFAGIDRFTFTVNDGQADSAPAEFAVTVTAAPKAGGCGCTTTSDFGLAGLLGLLALTRARSAPRRTRPLGGP